MERKREVQRVEFDQCFCTHICFMYDSMRHSKRVMLWELPKLAIKLATKRVIRQRNQTSKPLVETEREVSPIPASV